MSDPATGREQFLQGNIACAEGALAAGCRFFAGYPITPSSEIAEHLSIHLPRLEGVFIQMEDEISAMGAVIGASLTGMKALTATSGPGFSLKQENIGLAAIAQIPCVIVDVMRGGPSTGMPTMASQGDVQQARWGTHGDHPIIALCPSSVQEIFFETVRAFNLAEQYRNPVILLLDEVNAHMREKIVMPPPSELSIVNRKKPQVPPEEYLPFAFEESDIPPMASYGEGYRFHITGLCYDETGFPTNDNEKIEAMQLRLRRKIERYKAEMIRVEEMEMDDAEIAVVAYGSTARSARRAVAMARKEGHRIGLIRPITIWPFMDELLRRRAEQVRAFIVPEMNYGQVAREVERCAGNVPVIGVFKVNGEVIPPGLIHERIMEVTKHV
ncbi:2-oxoacid:acceptor oxidoreductase subunit alpha [bacterium]|nr:2-oxoacid:acceptor oxidoreductase subunit alpha [candidate division CSSED10-310 bacterium]